MNRLRSILSALSDFLFPRSARAIGVEELSTAEMLRILPPAAPLDTHTVAVFDYGHELVREMVWELKYQGNRAVAEKLAIILSDIILHELAERALTENFQSTERILLIPMPASDKRKNERGYNQTEILAREIVKLSPPELFKLVTGQLVKHRHTESQVHTATRAERLRNLEDSMHVVHPPAIAGRLIILIDDVTTTGATFAEARRALKAAGAKKILCIAVAH